MKNLTLLSLFKLALKYIWLLIICAAVFAAGAFVYCEFGATPKYSATGSVLVTNGAILSSNQNENDYNDSALSNTDIVASINFADTVTDILNTNGIFKKLAQELDNGDTYSDLALQATIERRSNTSLFIDITFTANTKKEAILLVNEFLELAPEYVNEFVPSTAAVSTSIADSAEKIFPRTAFYTFLSAIFGAALAYVLVIIRYSTNTTIIGEKDFKARFNIDVFASIPDFKTARSDKYYKKHPYYNSYYVKSHPKSDKNGRLKSKLKLVSTENQNLVPYAVVEAYKNLRINLTSALSKHESKVLAISSANASEGKSITSVNIAILLSQLNKKVILIDTDSRRASIHQKLKLQNEVGCLEVLSGSAELKDAITSYNPYLDIITAGKATSNSSELFDSPNFDRMLCELKNNYDYIIVDTPPINLVSDALVISQKCDDLLLIIRSKITSFQSFNRTRQSVERLNINLLGVVLNGVGADIDKYYGYYPPLNNYYSYSKQ